jgi:hypothetical protein
MSALVKGYQYLSIAATSASLSVLISTRLKYQVKISLFYSTIPIKAVIEYGITKYLKNMISPKG